MQICGLLVSADFEKIELSHLCEAFATAGPLETQIRGQGAQVSTRVTE